MNMYIYIYIYVYIQCNLMETQTWLSCNYEIISAENISILSVSSDDFSHAFLEVADIYIYIYIYIHIYIYIYIYIYMYSKSE